MARVYISSTFEDLKAHRQAVSAVVRKLGHEAVGMEDYNAEGSRPLDKCLRDVERSDAYIGIIAWRYGFIPTQDNSEGLSITELEYRKAIDLKKPVFIFLQSMKSIDGSLADAFTGQGESGKLIRRLRGELGRAHMVKEFDSVEDLGTMAATSLARIAPTDNRQALQELRYLGTVIFKLYTFKTVFDELQSLSMDTRLLRSEPPEGLTVQTLRAAARSGTDRLVSIKGRLQEADSLLSKFEKDVNQDHLKRFEARIADLADLAAASLEPDAPGMDRRITVIDEFNYRLRAWLAETNRLAKEAWHELCLSNLRALLDRLRPQVPGSFIDRLEDGYRQLREPPLFSKCDILAREHDLLQDTLKDFAMLRRELEHLDLDDLRSSCKAMKRRVASARKEWLNFVALPGQREPWETDLIGDGQDQWEDIDRCETDVAALLVALEESDAGIPPGLVDKES